MLQVDRGKYTRTLDEAYEDHPLSIGRGATISAPHMHVVALQALEQHLRPGVKVLDVGSGSGYLTACFRAMVMQTQEGEGEQERQQLEATGKVIGIEVVDDLVVYGRENVKRANPELAERVEIVKADGWKGFPSEAPFHAIHVGAAADETPQELLNQLAPGGRMIIPVGERRRSGQELLMIDKDKDGKLTTSKLFDVIYVPLVKTHA